MKEKVNIICVYWDGDFRGRDFSSDDVERLRATVDKHIDRPYEFFCLTNRMDEYLPAEKIPLKYDWPGWWAKMELYRPDLPIPQRRTLYMDLDSHAIRSLGPLLDFETDGLTMFRTREARGKRLNPPIGSVYVYQAATMMFDFPDARMTEVYDKFLRAPGEWIKRFRSDQDVIGAWQPQLPVFPAHWLIKLSSCTNMVRPPDDVIIVTGQPKDGLFRNLDEIPWFENMARNIGNNYGS